MKSKIIFFGDSIIKYKINNRFNDWSYELKKLIEKKIEKNLSFKTFSFTGLSSVTALKKLPRILRNNKKIVFFFIQLGINDSWHFKSLKGKPNVNQKIFQKNLSQIYLKCVKYRVKNIIFITYHKLLKNRIEINKKTINQNLNLYQKIIRKFCDKKKIFYVDMLKETKKIRSSKICLKLPDGVHLSKKGAKTYGKIIYKKIKKML